MKSYFRLMLGRGSVNAQKAFDDEFVGVDFGIDQDLTNDLPEQLRAFNDNFIPVYLAVRPDKTRIAAGLACGTLWTVAKGIRIGDVVLSPDGMGRYRVGEVTGEYVYAPGDVLPHRRPVKWLPEVIDRTDMSVPLKSSTGSIGTISNISSHADEIEKLLGSTSVPTIVSTDETVEDPSAFAMEKHLEAFLVENWMQTDFGKSYAIYEDEGEKVGQQFLTDTGPLDILAISNDKKSLLVVELKRGRASDVVVGQILRYMGYVSEELAEPGQSVRGVIIALDDDKRIRRALAVLPNVSFYRYQISFKLVKQ